MAYSKRSACVLGLYFVITKFILFSIALLFFIVIITFIINKLIKYDYIFFTDELSISTTKTYYGNPAE